jgi:hypothetical protein
MSKPVLLSGGNGKVSELAGTESRQVLTWSQTGEEWTPGPGVGGSGGGGQLFYLNELTSPDSPVVNIPTGASGTTVKELGASADGTGSTVSSTNNVPVLPNAPEIIAGFVTDLNVPDATEIPAGLWEFNVWAEATGGTTNQSYLQAKVYKYDGVNAPTAIATSAEVYLYDPREVTQYTLSVLIPGGVTLLATDRIYVEILGGSTTSNRKITLSFGATEPSHVHTTIIVPINLGTDVTGTLPVENGGTGASTLTGYVKASGTSAFTASAAIPVADVTGAAPLASPTFTGTVTIPTGASISGFAPLASPTFSGTPSLPTGTTGVTQSAGNNTTALATTAFVAAAVAASSGIPYDLPAEIPGTPAASTKVVNFKAARAFNLLATGHQGGQITNPSGNFICTVKKNATSIGTLTFGTSSFSTSITATAFAAGDVLSVETPAAALGIDTPFFTLFMTLA